MDRPSSKRSRSSDSFGRISSQSGDGTESTVSRDAKYSAYKDVNYAVVLETKNSFMRVSKAGIVDDDRTLCHRLLLADQPIPHESMFDDDRFEEFHSILQGRSEARVYLDLHPLLVPSAENLVISEQTTLENLVQGYNDPWVKTIPFYGPRPQPDHTVGFRWPTFTNEQRRKLGIDPSAKSYYTAREDIYFPFLTSEIKCGKQALDLADRQNAHSMTIAVRAVVELFRNVGRAMEVHRNILGFSISHDAKTVRIYGHYPEIDGESTAYLVQLRPYSELRSAGARPSAYRAHSDVLHVYENRNLLVADQQTVVRSQTHDAFNLRHPDRTRQGDKIRHHPRQQHSLTMAVYPIGPLPLSLPRCFVDDT